MADLMDAKVTPTKAKMKQKRKDFDAAQDAENASTAGSRNGADRERRKNVFGDTDAAREARFHVSTLLITVLYDAQVTYGELAHDPAVQVQWDAYCAAPQGVCREKWTRDTAAARALLGGARVAAGCAGSKVPARWRPRLGGPAVQARRPLASL